MRKLGILLFLLLPASAQSFFGLGVEDRHVFSHGQALPSGLWWGVGLDHNGEWSARLYLRRGGRVNPISLLLSPVGGLPGSYYGGLQLEGGYLPGPEGVYAPFQVAASALAGLEIYLGDQWALFLEALSPLYGPTGPRAGSGLRYYLSGREVHTAVSGTSFRLYLDTMPAWGSQPSLGLAYERDSWALWFRFWFGSPGVGGHVYLEDFLLGAGVGFGGHFGRPVWPTFYAGYRFPLGEALEGQFRLEIPVVSELILALGLIAPRFVLVFPL
jgi:hypothetical protein